MKSSKEIKLPKEGSRNTALDKYSDRVLFPDKLKKANDILKKVGIPKI